MRKKVLFFWTFLFLLSLASCKKEKPISKNEALFNKYCASCHIAPKIDELPKDIWKNSILPNMGSRMEIEEMYQDPNNKSTGFKPKIKLNDWVSLQSYIVALAPEKLAINPIPKTKPITLFKQKPLALDSQNGALITFLEFNDTNEELYYGTVSGTLSSYSFKKQTNKVTYQTQTPITWFNKTKEIDYITEVGILDPSELEKGSLLKVAGKDTLHILEQFHRPVHNLVKDLNGDGVKEMVISEFGNKTGKLSLMIENDTMGFDKKVLMNLPGCMKTVAKDMNKDGKLDLVSFFSQGNERIVIFYQEENLKFRAETAIAFSPVYGSSWFQLIDYNHDGFIDIITVNGDNADESYVNKPYHGMRIHLNDGKNKFTETYFYPLYGATRVIANDFDQDNDVDFALISTFPDYDNTPQFSFVYLENTNSLNYDFKTQILKDPSMGRWFLMDTGDIDSDGDDDIILSSFTYVFTPVPDALSKRWKELNTDVLVLENNLH